MAEEKKKHYAFKRKWRCKACDTVAKVAGPCSKCGKLVFYTEYNAVEQK